MPHKPRHPCSWPGCPELTDRRYCPHHEKLAAKQYEQHERDPATRARYGRSWQRIRKAYTEEHPLCEMCLEEGRVTPVEQVHHKVPLAEGGTNAWSNLISLCTVHHSKLHAERGDRWHGKQPPRGR